MKGFTLIELLVVVLIIGILASMALPSYRKATKKARAMRALPLIKTISDAQNVFYMEHGRYANSFDGLPIGLPAGAKKISSTNWQYKDFTCFFHYEKNLPASIYCNDIRPGNVRLEKYFQSTYFLCWGGGNEETMDMCRDISGHENANAGSQMPQTGFTF